MIETLLGSEFVITRQFLGGVPYAVTLVGRHLQEQIERVAGVRAPDYSAWQQEWTYLRWTKGGGTDEVAEQDNWDLLKIRLEVVLT